MCHGPKSLHHATVQLTDTMIMTSLNNGTLYGRTSLHLWRNVSKSNKI